MLPFITAGSVLAAAIAIAIAWRVVREDRRRSDVRVAALASDLSGPDLELRPFDGARGRPFDAAQRRPAAAAMRADFFRHEAAGRGGSRLTIVLVVGVLAVGTALGVIVAASRTARPDGGGTGVARDREAGPVALTPAAAAAREARTAGAAALELVALGHDRDADRITVRGIVRNPDGGAALDRLDVVVFLFDRDGGFLGSGRTDLESPALGPGLESQFLVTVATAADVSRYRVSFRSRDRIVPHVDRRESGTGTVAQLK